MDIYRFIGVNQLLVKRFGVFALFFSGTDPIKFSSFLFIDRCFYHANTLLWWESLRESYVHKAQELVIVTYGDDPKKCVTKEHINATIPVLLPLIPRITAGTVYKIK